jgi:hypothetical protein
MAKKVRADDYHIDELERVVEQLEASMELTKIEYIDDVQFQRILNLSNRLLAWMFERRKAAP